eukprot:NODE_553_length_6120_cov_0.628135.p2 type:complete len:205 gc:universal NODE_553_length_6120_cov_0.628135:3420-2806(-)
MTMDSRPQRVRNQTLLQNAANEEDIIAAIGDETASEEEYSDTEIIDDQEYNPSEDYRGNDNDTLPTTRQRASRRVPKKPFFDTNIPFNFSEFHANMKTPKTNLPTSFPANPKPIHYFSLLYTHTMMKEVKNEMNCRYNEHLNAINFSQFIPDDNDGSFDPLNPIDLSSGSPSNQPTTANIQISFISTQDVYRFFGVQITMGLIG